MAGPQVPASSGAVAFGVALLFASGVGGFYFLAEVARPRHHPAPQAPRYAPLPDEGDGPPALGAPAGQPAADTDPDWDDFIELPDFFPVPATMPAANPAALPGR
jgi:hypothetical protein